MSASTGYHITHVYVDSADQGAITSYTFSNVQSNHAISVTSAINTYTITPSAGAGGSINPSTPQTVNYGSNSPTFYITPYSGYHITDVVVDSTTHLGAVSSYQFTNTQASHTIAAYFAQDGVYYSLTISAGTGGTTTPTPGTYSYAQGTNLQATAANSTGYIFTNWILDETNTTSNPLTVTMNSNHNLTAYFTATQSSTLFEDGFETANFNQWTSTYTTTGETTTITSTLPHHGSYAGLFASNGSGGTERAYIYKDVTETDELYVRGYFNIDSGLPLQDNDERFNLFALQSSTATIASLSVRRYNKADVWSITSNVGTWYAQSGPSMDSWYCVEFYAKIDSNVGVFKMYVNGQSVIEQTGLNTAGVGDIACVRAGLVYISGVTSSLLVYGDCYEFSDGYVGLEDSLTIFQDGFEGGNFSAWTSIGTSAGETASVVSNPVYVGSYGGAFASDGGGGYERAYVYKSLGSSVDEVFVRGYFRLSASGIVDNGDRIKLITVRSGSSVLAAAGLRWWLETRDGSSYVESYGALAGLDISQWFSIQLKWAYGAIDGGGSLWVGDSLIYQVDDADSDDFGLCSEIRFGLAEMYDCTSTVVYADDAVIGSVYVEP